MPLTSSLDGSHFILYLIQQVGPARNGTVSQPRQDIPTTYGALHTIWLHSQVVPPLVLRSYTCMYKGRSMNTPSMYLPLYSLDGHEVYRCVPTTLVRWCTHCGPGHRLLHHERVPGLLCQSQNAACVCVCVCTCMNNQLVVTSSE